MDMEKLKRRTLYREKNMEEISNSSEEEEEEEEEETVQEEDDGWNNDVLAQIQVGNKKYDNRLKVLRRSFAEMTIAFVVHLIFLIYCTGVHIYDATVFKRCPEPEKFFVGYNTFGGHFKHLTHIFMWGFLVYFFLAFFTDIMPQSGAKVWFREQYKQRSFGWVWLEGRSNLQLEQALEVGRFGYPALVAVNGRKGAYSALKGSYSNDGIKSFVRELIGMRLPPVSINGGKLPTVETTEPWDGKDGELPVEDDDIDLSDVQLDDEPSKDEL